LGAEGFDFLHKGVHFFGGRGGGVGAEVVGGVFGGLEEFGGSGSERGFGDLRLSRAGSGIGLRRSLRKRDAPEVGGGFGELEFDVKAGGWIVAAAGDLSNDFAAGLRIGEEEKLARSSCGGETNDAAIRKDQRGRGVFFEEFALAGIVGASASGEHGGFVGNGAAAERGTRTRRGRGTSGVGVCYGNQNASPSCARKSGRRSQQWSSRLTVHTTA